MGSFVGHALPGTFFILFGVWWTVRIFQRYFGSLTRRGSPYLNTVTFPPVMRRCPNMNLEALIAAAGAAIGIFVEIIAACFMRGLPVGVTNGQHATMYFFFGLVGFMCLVMPFVKRTLPGINHDAEYLTLLLAYVAESLLFMFHLFGRQNVDILVHTLLLYSAYACVFATALEMAYRNNVLASLSRAYFTVLQGTWFWQTGFLLYNPFKGNSWGEHGGGSHSHEDMGKEATEDEHHQFMLITIIFAWHMAVLFILTLVTGALIGCRYRSRGDLDDNKILLQTRFSEPPNGYTVVDNNINEDDL